MEHKMRRKDRELTREEGELILISGEYGVLASVDQEGWPYAVPLSYVYVDDKIYFHCAKHVGHKLDNIRYSDKVCFTVVGKTEVDPAAFSTNYESVIVFGHIKELALKENACMALIEKYAPAFIASGKEYTMKFLNQVAIYEITIEKLSAKARK